MAKKKISPDIWEEYERICHMLKIEIGEIDYEILTDEKIDLIETMVHSRRKQLEENANFFQEEGYNISYGPVSDRDERYRKYYRLSRKYLALDPKEKLKKTELALKIAKIAEGLERWNSAIKIYETIKSEPFFDQLPNNEQAPIYKGLGLAKTKRNREAYRQFLEGRDDFIIAQQKNPNDSDLYAAIAGSFKDFNDNLALHYYRKAYSINKKNPYPFGNLLILELMRKQKFKLSNKRIKEITSLVDVRESQIQKFEDIPWAFFDLGMFFLFIGDLEKSIDYYLLAIRFSPNEWMIKTTLNTIDKIENLHDEIPGIHTIRKLLLFGMALNLKRNLMSKSKSFKDILKELEDKYHFKNNSIPYIKEILIFSGDRYSIEDHLFSSYSFNLKEAFLEFRGSILCSCVNYGMHDFLNEIRTSAPNIPIYLYIPKGRYEEYKGLYYKIYQSNGDDFSKTDIFQYWFDILNSEIDLKNIKLLGIGGKDFSYFEYRVAISFGAHVGIIKDSMGAALEIIENNNWKEIIEDIPNQMQFRLYNIIDNSKEDIINFLESKGIKSLVNEKIKKIIVQYADGPLIYTKDISRIQVPVDIITGFMSSLASFGQRMGEDELKTIEFGGLKFNIHPIKTGSIFIIFITSENPGMVLRDKIKDFASLLEDRLGDEILALKGGRTFPKIKIDKITAHIFGSEIV